MTAISTLPASPGLWTPAKGGLILPPEDPKVGQRPSGLWVPRRSLDLVRAGSSLVIAQPGVVPSDVVAEAWRETAARAGEAAADMLHGSQRRIVDEVDAAEIRRAIVAALQAGRVEDAVRIAGAGR